MIFTMIIFFKLIYLNEILLVTGQNHNLSSIWGRGYNLWASVLHLLGVFKINSHPFFPLVKLFLGLYIQTLNKKILE